MALLAPGLTRAAPAPDSASTVSELTVTASKTVDELTVTAPKKCLKPTLSDHWAHSPRVVSTFPAKDAVVRPGILVIRVTFDQPMACAGMFKDDPPLSDPCPGFKHDLLLSLDRMTVRTACVVEPGRHYGALIRRGDDDDSSTFLSLAGARPSEYEFRFKTSDAAPVTTVCEALTEDEQTARELSQRRKLDCAPRHAP
ncbi:hypothetical protein [Phenylobacterium sp.]|uniref:hypothetical protein n=1 Tax=Phenylobacterium sp. TaxID=1871053 RepID=UPI002C18B675|nr:hypothetical protein [Phenylobacterium sp.]HLZ77500.1 hypothetical protein [Phenylobacterium sp.]